MIRYIRYEQIDKLKWDECISQSIHSLVYGYSWYLDIVCKRWDALVKDDYEAVFPLTSNRKYGFSYLYQPYFTQQLGVFSPKHLTGKMIENFIDAIPREYRFIEINLNSSNPTDGIKYKASKQLNHLLDLKKPYTDLFKGYSQNIRRNIKTAKEQGIKTGFNIEPNDVIDLFRRYKGKEFTHIKNSHYTMLLFLIRSLMDKNMVICSGACINQDELSAGIFWVKMHNRAIFLFSAASPEAKESGAMSWLIDSFIREHADKEMILDFEGSNNPGLARFYKSFGSYEEHYSQLKINRLLVLMQLIKK
jgi:hypothetical protein